ncbi:isochorismate synthase [Nonomuraea dietziae]|uniref:isochorismate synthase n=2 Tax=Nonomuraea dietziae TaxID=65515 RepID=UPI0035E70F33
MPQLTTAADPLADYDRATSVLVASSRGTLLTHGIRAAVDGRLDTLPARAAAILGADELVAGAISFDGVADLLVPKSAIWSPALPAGAPAFLRGGWSTRPLPSPADYIQAVRQALVELGTGRLDKVVLARSLELRSNEPVNVAELLRPLLGHGHGYAFAAPLPSGTTLVGSSPELLVSRHGLSVVSNPLAGSAARSPDAAEDRRRAAALLASAKDRREHRFVVEAVTEALQPYCAHLDVPRVPELTSTDTLWHLSSRIVGTLRDADTSVLTLAAALHPTPAVCGTPTAEARQQIQRLEPIDRGHYSGLVGWMDARGDGEWAVAIRCAEVAENTLRLFAGAGIVAGSDPAAELAETTVKFQTMLRALGADIDARHLERT